MADSTYAGWSIHDLKAAAAAAKPAELEHDVTSFADGESAMRGIRERFDAALAQLADGWTGTAAQAATTNARTAIATLTDTSQTAATTSSAVVGYAQSVRDAQQAVAAIPDKSFDWGEAFTAGSFAGPVGIGGDALVQALEAEQHRKHAVELVEQMDHAGRAHADVMKGMPWAPSSGFADAPTALTPPPGATTSDRSTMAPAGSRMFSPADTPTRPRTAGGTSFTDEEYGVERHGGRRVETVRTTGEGTARDTTATAGGFDLPLPQAQADVAASSQTSGAGVAVPGTTAAAALGGAGVAAGGLATTAGQASAAVGTSAAFRDAPPGIDAESNKRQGAARSGTAERTGGRVEAEPNPASASRPPISELAVRERGAHPAGGYPLGPAAEQRRDDEDELRARPEYLVESDEIWGDGRTAAPPVLG